MNPSIYTRAVLPDEIDADPVDAPSFAHTAYLAYQQAFREFEALTGTVDFLDTVARIKAALSRPVEMQGNRRALSSARPWEPCSDNVGVRAEEPAPDEWLIERVAALLSVQGGASFQWAELRPDTKGIWLNRARAVLAEIAQGGGAGTYATDSVHELDLIESALRGTGLPGATSVAKVTSALKERVRLLDQRDAQRTRAIDAEKRVAELEAELADEILSANSLRSSAESLTTDLAIVTRERDETQRCINQQTLEIEALGGKADEWERMYNNRNRLWREATDQVDSLTRELAEAKQAKTDEYIRTGMMARELAEAREELRLQRELETAARIVCSQSVWILGDKKLQALDAHRAKTSDSSASPATAESGAGEQASGTTATDGSELPYETAPRLTKGVRYRVVEYSGSHERQLQAGDEHIADGTEALWPHKPPGQGWYALGPGQGLHRVVRVDPEKAKKCAVLGCVDGVLVSADYETANCPDPSHDGGGERSGGMPSPEVRRAVYQFHASGERSGQVDEGPPRVGDVVRVISLPVWECSPRHEVGCDYVVSELRGNTQALLDVGRESRGLFLLVTDPDRTVGTWCKVEVIRRAAQPEAKAALPIDAEDERVVDALVHRKTADRAETPLLGPHAGTVADLVRRVERIEGWLALPTAGPAAEAIEEEIRVERAGSGK